jgi:hypothetical protein
MNAQYVIPIGRALTGMRSSSPAAFLPAMTPRR